MAEQSRSGYEAVYADLCRTKTAEAVLDSVRRWCSVAYPAGYDFRVETDADSGTARTRTVWAVRFGPIEQDFRNDEYTQFRLDVDRVLDEDEAWKRVLEAHFGRDVGTRNCKRYVCWSGKSFTKEKHQRGFSGAFTEYALAHPGLLEIRKQEEARIVGGMIRTSQGDEFARRRDQALCDAARAEVRRVMLKYRAVPDSVLAEAVREAAVEGVMDW